MQNPTYYTITYTPYKHSTQTVRAVRRDLKSAMKHAYHIVKNSDEGTNVRVCEGESGLPVAVVN